MHILPALLTAKMMLLMLHVGPMGFTEKLRGMCSTLLSHWRTISEKLSLLFFGAFALIWKVQWRLSRGRECVSGCCSSNLLFYAA